MCQSGSARSILANKIRYYEKAYALNDARYCSVTTYEGPSEFNYMAVVNCYIHVDSQSDFIHPLLRCTPRSKISPSKATQSKMQLSILLMLVVQTAAMYITVPTKHLLAAAPTLTVTIASHDMSSMVISTSIGVSTPTIPFSTLMTIAPLSRNPLELRQKCFDDRGFSVNCATWTGYYYTWGGAGHPYAGGPGDGSGSGSNGGGRSSNAITGIIGSGNRLEAIKWQVIGALATIGMILML